MRAISPFQAIAAAMGLCMLLGGCVSSAPHQTALGPRPAVDGRLPPPTSPVVDKVCTSNTACVVFVEFDDYGNLMNRAQMLGTLQAADMVASAQGTVLVYVHGWHNDAANGTRDVEAFKTLVQRASENDRIFRPNHPGSGNILGVYVGWRGDSISSEGWTTPFSYLLTFWDRKGAAHDIGNSGGVYDLLSRLSAVRRAHEKSKLLIHGHSFGAAVVFSTVSHTLMDQIRMDGRDSTSPAPRLADLVVLLNPAFEAMKLRPQIDMARTQEYQSGQPPRLVVITTEADWATGITFPLGRQFGTLFDAYADSQSSAQNKTALGHYIPYVTHQLAKPQGSECSQPPAAAPSPLAPHASAGIDILIAEAKPTLCIPTLPFYPKSVPLLLQRCDKAGQCAEVADDHYIARGPVAEGYVPFRLPIMNIRTTKDVSTGHTDIRNDVLENFVLQLLALAVRDPGTAPTGPVIPMMPNPPQ